MSFTTVLPDPVGADHYYTAKGCDFFVGPKKCDLHENISSCFPETVHQSMIDSPPEAVVTWKSHACASKLFQTRNNDTMPIKYSKTVNACSNFTHINPEVALRPNFGLSSEDYKQSTVVGVLIRSYIDNAVVVIEQNSSTNTLDMLPLVEAAAHSEYEYRQSTWIPSCLTRPQTYTHLTSESNGREYAISASAKTLARNPFFFSS